MRRLRREGKIPAVAYGAGKPAQALAISPKELVEVLSSEHGRNSVIGLNVEGQAELTVLLSDFQVHPVTRALLHADFLSIDVNQPVDVDIPLELIGRPQGVVMGGTLRQVFRKLPMRCLPAHIPVKVSYDVTHLDLDQHVSVSDLALPEGVTVRLAQEQTVASVVTEKHRGATEEEEQAAAAAAAGTAPAAAAEAPAPTK
jgi:large subunit ribosomal protein L25